MSREMRNLGHETRSVALLRLPLAGLPILRLAPAPSARRSISPATSSTPRSTPPPTTSRPQPWSASPRPPTLDVVSFGFHPALKVTKITDEQRQAARPASAPPTAPSASPPAAPFVAGQTAHWTFVYDGAITGNEDGPVEGLKLAAIQEPITYLLYAARWFPTTGYMTDRFTAEMHIRVPQGMRVFASGATGQRPSPSPSPAASPATNTTSTGPSPDFPAPSSPAAMSTPSPPAPATSRSTSPSATRPPATSWPRPPPRSTTSSPTASARRKPAHLNVVELPDDTLPAAWAPELAAIMGSRVGDKSGVRLLANTIAHQWWGSEVSPRTLNDAWITNGMSRYGELMYVEDESGKSALRAALAGCCRRRARLRHHPAVQRRPPRVPSRPSSSP